MDVVKTLTYNLLLILFSFQFLLLVGCSDDEEEPLPPTEPLHIVVDNIRGVPEGVTFDRLAATIAGKEWGVISTVTAIYNDTSAELILPATFSAESLIPCQRSTTSRDYGSGFWPAQSSNSLAMVAGVDEIVAYNGETPVGRIYMTDWPGRGSTYGKTYIYYHYTTEDFSLSGTNAAYSVSGTASFRYSAAFQRGWNIYANIRPENRNAIEHCTTDIPDGLELGWLFEKW